VITKAQGLFLVAAGLFNVLVWPRFALAISRDDRAWAGEHWHSRPTAFFWVHAVLIVTATLFALGILWIAWRAHVTAHAGIPNA
jgi:hypothetical protein